MTESLPQIHHPLPRGTWVRLTRDLKDFHGQNRSQGHEFEIEEFVTAGDASKDEVAVDFYYGNTEGGMGNLWAPADAVEIVRTVAQQRARELPGSRALLQAIAHNLSGGNDFNITESQFDGNQKLEVFGKTFDGLSFGFRILVEEIWETDD